ncbi:MAG: chemotaxis response regulator protein-glutamate methylesterase [Oceanospirillales bacterium]|uniref:Protein-glutamate methylesterase/protein-glutamine glutaminase n=1 Tax=Marinobacterium halophilum TaxID=267374 RepID=A0A2P8F245_9GAMM|nr:chemotaxis response regulator protein-glutamate methylesterase [Marinobacterium halophilum]MBR9827634.1 chemotaxis response regulator protein-glutamate methylesterase [Oceanospirillales bacterium]PSL15766.1 two-component system chemotaxis response regulator CheB [Marinobacterium halophilum]
MSIDVLIVDDSAVVRQVLVAQLDGVAGIRVIGTASDPIFARKKMEKQWPDVIVLDIEMPRMDGITFLKQLMLERPTPVVICSTLTERGAETTMRAMAAGAVEIITKPRAGLKQFLQSARNELIDAIKAAASAQPSRMNHAATASVAAARSTEPLPKLNADSVLPKANAGKLFATTDRVVALGTSTGGTQALEHVLSRLPVDAPGIIVVQHMPAQFTHAFAERLDGICRVTVKEAQNNDRVMPGRVLIAPGGQHMMLRRSGAQYRVEVRDGPLVSRHKPSVDVLFRSVASAAGPNAVGIIMTGMGDDGAHGLLEMRQAGAATFGQNEASCVVYGMPKEAFKLGAVGRELSLQEIPRLITEAVDAR